MKTRHLSGNQHTRAGSHLSSAYLTMSFGPPKLISRTGVAIQVGLIQDATIMQQRTISRFMEIGNKEQWLVPSKVRSSLQLRRILYDGPTLMKYAAYALLGDKLKGQDENDIRSWVFDKSIGADHAVRADSKINQAYEDLMDALGIDEDDAPGAEDFWMNLASELFAEPIGVVVELKQQMPNGTIETYGGMFLENCLISNHSFQITAEQRLLSESVSMEFTKVVPLGENKGKSIQQIELMLRQAF